jgi:hypothetical protein
MAQGEEHMSTHGDGGKGSARRKEDASKVRDNWDRIFGIKKEKDLKTLEDHVWNDQLKEMQRDVELKLIKGEDNE